MNVANLRYLSPLFSLLCEVFIRCYYINLRYLHYCIYSFIFLRGRAHTTTQFLLGIYKGHGTTASFDLLISS